MTTLNPEQINSNIVPSEGDQSIGFPLDFNSGTLTDLEISSGGRLQLKSVGQGFFLPMGTWESDVINLEGKYTTLENLAMDKVTDTGHTVIAETRTSDNGTVWDEYIEIDYSTGKIMSIPRQYVQIRITLQSELMSGGARILHTDFSIPASVQGNPFVEANGKLKLKTGYNFQMKEQNWEEEGSLFRTTISKSDFKRIDSIRVD